MSIRPAASIDEVVQLLTGVSSVDAALARLKAAGIPANVKIEVWDGYVAQADLDTESGQDSWSVWPTRSGSDEHKQFAQMRTPSSLT